MFSDHKKLRNEEKHFIKKSQNLIYYIFLKKHYVFYGITSQTDRQNIYRIFAYICEEFS